MGGEHKRGMLRWSGRIGEIGVSLLHREYRCGGGSWNPTTVDCGSDG